MPLGRQVYIKQLWDSTNFRLHSFLLLFRFMDLRLLLIDDDPIFLQVLSETISFHFPILQVTTVESGPAALREVTRQQYDIVVCDLLMPGMDGAKTLAEIRKDDRRLRNFLLTGHPEPEQVYESTHATGFLKKPLDRPSFLALMQRTMDVLSVEKNVQSRLMRAKQLLSSSIQYHARVDNFLRQRGVRTSCIEAPGCRLSTSL